MRIAVPIESCRISEMGFLHVVHITIAAFIKEVWEDIPMRPNNNYASSSSSDSLLIKSFKKRKVCC